MMNKKGFTLVELMVVIVIIGVLAAVAIPKFSAATNKAKASEMPSVMSQIMSAQDVFITETNKYGPEAGGSVTGGKTSQAGTLKSVLGVDASGSRYFEYTVTSANGASLSAITSTIDADVAVSFGDAEAGTDTYTLQQIANGTIQKAAANSTVLENYVRSFDAQYTTEY